MPSDSTLCVANEQVAVSRVYTGRRRMTVTSNNSIVVGKDFDFHAFGQDLLLLIYRWPTAVLPLKRKARRRSTVVQLDQNAASRRARGKQTGTTVQSAVLEEARWNSLLCLFHASLLVETTPDWHGREVLRLMPGRRPSARRTART